METILGLDVATWWFLVIGGLITGYGVLDGFEPRCWCFAPVF